MSSPARGRFTRVAEIPAIRVWSVAEAPEGDLWVGNRRGALSSRRKPVPAPECGRRPGPGQYSLHGGFPLRGCLGWLPVFQHHHAYPRPGTAHDAFRPRSGVHRWHDACSCDGCPGPPRAGTEQGTFFWDGDAWIHYDHGDGLVWDDCGLHALSPAPDGSVWIGTRAGLSRFSPSGRPNSAAPPEVVFTALQSAARSSPRPPAPPSMPAPTR